MRTEQVQEFVKTSAALAWNPDLDDTVWVAFLADIEGQLAGHGYRLQVLHNMPSYAAQDEVNKVIYLAMHRRGVPVPIDDRIWSGYHDFGHVVDARTDEEYLRDFRPTIQLEMACDKFGLDETIAFLNKHGVEHNLHPDLWKERRYSTPRHTAEWLQNLNKGRGFTELDQKQVHAIADHLDVEWDNSPTFMRDCQQTVGKSHLDDMTPEELWTVVQMMVQQVLGEPGEVVKTAMKFLRKSTGISNAPTEQFRGPKRFESWSKIEGGGVAARDAGQDQRIEHAPAGIRAMLKRWGAPANAAKLRVGGKTFKLPKPPQPPKPPGEKVAKMHCEDNKGGEALKGGLADGMPNRRFPTEQLRKGMKVEREHTSDPRAAKEVAKDHLVEDRKYYDKLEKMEKKAGGDLAEMLRKGRAKTAEPPPPKGWYESGKTGKDWDEKLQGMLVRGKEAAAYYHGTRPESHEKILREGLSPSHATMPDEKVTFFTNKPEYAGSFSKHWWRKKMDLPLHKKVWHSVMPGPIKGQKVLRVDVPKEHEGTISKNKRLGDFTSSRHIPAEWISEHKLAAVKIGPPPSPNRKEYPYQGSCEFQGIKILIENKRGSIRSGTGPGGKKWRTVMPHHYGEVPRSLGADGDPVDVYVGPNEKSDVVYIVHQLKSPKFKSFDEDKVMLGFTSAAEAKKQYLRAYDSNKYFGSMSVCSVEDFKKALKNRSVRGKRISTALVMAKVARGRTEQRRRIRKGGKELAIGAGTGLALAGAANKANEALGNRMYNAMAAGSDARLPGEFESHAARLRAVGATLEHGTGGEAFYHRAKHHVSLGGLTYPEVLAHEVGHAVDPWKKGMNRARVAGGAIAGGLTGAGLMYGAEGLAGKAPADRARSFRRARNLGLGAAVARHAPTLLNEARASLNALKHAPPGRGPAYRKVLAPAYGGYLMGATKALALPAAAEVLRRRALREEEREGRKTAGAFDAPSLALRLLGASGAAKSTGSVGDSLSHAVKRTLLSDIPGTSKIHLIPKKIQEVAAHTLAHHPETIPLMVAPGSPVTVPSYLKGKGKLMDLLSRGREKAASELLAKTRWRDRPKVFKEHLERTLPRHLPEHTKIKKIEVTRMLGIGSPQARIHLRTGGKNPVSSEGGFAHGTADVGLHKKFLRKKWHVEADSLYLKTKFQRRGIGAAAVQGIAGAGKSLGATHVGLEADDKGKAVWAKTPGIRFGDKGEKSRIRRKHNRGARKGGKPLLGKDFKPGDVPSDFLHKYQPKDMFVRYHLPLQKQAASGMRSRVKLKKVLAPRSIQGMMAGEKTGPRWGMFLGDKQIGFMDMTPGDHSRVSLTHIDEKFRGMGLGKKMYGEVMRRQPGQTLKSDTMVSTDAQRVWRGMSKKPSYKVRENALAGSTRGYLNAGGDGIKPVTYAVSSKRPIFQASLPAASAVGTKSKPSALPGGLAGYIDPSDRESIKGKFLRGAGTAGRVAAGAGSLALVTAPFWAPHAIDYGFKRRRKKMLAARAQQSPEQEKQAAFRPSKIHGKGFFTDEAVKKGKPIALAFNERGLQSREARKTNHSKHPNAEVKKKGKLRFMVALRDLDKGVEVTVDYGKLNLPELGLKGIAPKKKLPKDKTGRGILPTQMDTNANKLLKNVRRQGRPKPIRYKRRAGWARKGT